MTFWNYSGRGRGRGRGAGRGGGRFGSHHPAARGGGMSWVRGGGGTGGRGNYAVGKARSGSSKWVRPKEATDAVKKDELLSTGASSSCLVDHEAPPAAENLIPEKTTIPLAATSLVKRGSYQLVASDKGESSPGKPQEKVPELNIATEAIRGVENRDHSDNSKWDAAETRNVQNLKRVGRHKLVVEVTTTNKKDSDDTGQAPQVSPKYEQAANIQGGKGKIADADAAYGGDGKTAERQDVVLKSHVSINNGERLALKRGGSKKRPLPSHFHSRRPVAHRIKLTNHYSEDPSVGDNADVDYGQVPESVAGSSTKAGQPQEKLSDFAYHETGRVVRVQQQHQNRTWNKAGASSNSGSNANPTDQQQCFEGPRKMGLVRAKHTNAPICPFYAKGLECTDQFCRKRHDVPKESAVPVCSFFQRKGQCFKDDCKFRHVKTRGIVCPTFALLGYCDNTDCTMKHLRPPPKTSAKTKGPPATGNRTYVRQP